MSLESCEGYNNAIKDIINLIEETNDLCIVKSKLKEILFANEYALSECYSHLMENK